MKKFALLPAGSYQRAVAWIAEHDPNTTDMVHGSISVCLVADLYGKEQAEVAHMVRSLRKPTQPKRVSVREARQQKNVSVWVQPGLIRAMQLNRLDIRHKFGVTVRHAGSPTGRSEIVGAREDIAKLRRAVEYEADVNSDLRVRRVCRRNLSSLIVHRV